MTAIKNRGLLSGESQVPRPVRDSPDAISSERLLIGLGTKSKKRRDPFPKEEITALIS